MFENISSPGPGADKGMSVLRSQEGSVPVSFQRHVSTTVQRSVDRLLSRAQTDPEARRNSFTLFDDILIVVVVFLSLSFVLSLSFILFHSFDSYCQAPTLECSFLVFYHLSYFFLFPLSLSPIPFQETPAIMPMFTAWRTIFENLVDVARHETGLPAIEWLKHTLAAPSGDDLEE